MSIDVRIISIPDFVRVDASGTLDIDESRAILRQIAAECKECGVKRVFSDCREVRRGPDIVELYWLVESFSEIGIGPELRLAILYIERGLGQARSFRDMAQNRGFQVELFEDFEAAFNWLMETADSRPQTMRGG